MSKFSPKGVVIVQFYDKGGVQTMRNIIPMNEGDNVSSLAPRIVSQIISLCESYSINDSYTVKITFSFSDYPCKSKFSQKVFVENKIQDKYFKINWFYDKLLETLCFVIEPFNSQEIRSWVKKFLPSAIEFVEKIYDDICYQT